MITTCPSCGSSMDVDLPVVDLNTNTVSFGDDLIIVTPRVAEVLFYIISKHPRKVRSCDLYDAVWRGTYDAAHSNVTTQVCHARRILYRMGYTISTHARNGYRLELLGETTIKYKGYRE